MPNKKKDRAEHTPEFISRMRADPERATFRKSIHEATELETQDQAPLAAELQSLGIRVDSAWDIKEEQLTPEVIGVLVRHVQQPYSTRSLEGIVRALITRKARGVAGPTLIQMFRSVKDESLQWIIGNAINEVATADDLEAVLAFARDPSLWESRSPFAATLARLRKQAAIPDLLGMLKDPHQLVAAEAIEALGKLGAFESRAAVEPFLEHADSWVRSKARTALRRMDRAEQRRKRKRT